MTLFSGFLAAFVCAYLASLLAAAAIVVTRYSHGHLTLDNDEGVQKLHTAPTPRVGGIALCLGVLAGGLLLPAGAQWFWVLICLSAIPAIFFGLLEDVTKRVGVKSRLLATICAGLIFCLLTGNRITEVDIPGIDWVLSFWLPSLLFTAFAIGGIANAVNIIDGVNGLASGTSLIVLIGFGVVAWQVGDMPLVGACLVSIGALLGFFFLNFPMGRLFLGDGGAYFVGFVLAVIAVALPHRNPELSPLIGVLALSYPVIETMISIQRRMTRTGSNPGQPDRLHLHSLVYRSLAKRLAENLGVPHLRNALTGLVLLGLPILSSVLTVLFKSNSALVSTGFAVVTVAYIVSYRKVALMGSRVKRRRRRAT